MKQIFKQKILITLLTIAALAVGQSAWATTKTVTYKITSVNRKTVTAYEIVFTRQNDATRTDDDPFDTSAPTTYTASVPIGFIENNQSGYFSVQLADGFQLNSSWSANSTVKFTNNCIYPSASNKYITYSVSCSNDNYYVTHVMMTGYNSNYQQGLLQPSPHLNDPIDYDYSSEWHFSQSYHSCYAFGQITITYTDVPLLSIFESDGENAYKIKDKYDLRHLAAYVNNGGNNCSGLTFRQTQAITCDATYVPIGYRFSSSNRSYFNGTYDGQGHTVSGITVSRTGGSEADGCIGLFGYVEYGGTVQNVVLASSTFTGNDKIGGIVGLNWGGTVKNCRVESSVTIKAGCNNAWNHGGIVGYNDSGTIEGCVSAASIVNNGKSSHQFCGGITGRTSSTIRDCLYTGTTIEAADYKGAICGYSDGGATYANNYYTAIALGGVGAEGGSSDQDGARRARTVTLGENIALVGNETAYNLSGLTAIGTGNCALSYNDGTTTTLYSGEGQTLTLDYNGTVPEGYIVVYSYNDGTDHSVTDNTFEMPAYDITVSSPLVDVWGVTDGADGSEDKPYIISTAAGWDALAAAVNRGERYYEKFFKLSDDFDNSATPVTTMAGWGHIFFSGTILGNGRTLTVNLENRNLEEEGCAPFFRTVGATIKNLRVAGIITTDNKMAAGIVSHMQRTTLEGCVSSVTIISSVSGDGTHGGVVGVIESGAGSSDVRGCVFDGVICCTAENLTHSCGGIAGWKEVGTNWLDCLYAPAAIPEGKYPLDLTNCRTFARIESGSFYANSFYTEPLGDVQNSSWRVYPLDTCPANVDPAVVNDYGFTKTYNNHCIEYNGKFYVHPETCTLNESGNYSPDVTNGYFANITLGGRTLYKDGYWNTLCLPFDVTATQIAASDLAGADIRTLSSASFENSTLTLNFTAQGAVTSIQAGVPYIIKWASGTDVVSPTINAVIIDNTAHDVTCDLGDDKSIVFKGTQSATTFTEDDNTKLFVGTANTLYYPKVGASIKAQRAYFQLSEELRVKSEESPVKAFILNFDGEDSETGLNEELRVKSEESDAVYDLSGRKIANGQKPKANGIYIVGGKKIFKK